MDFVLERKSEQCLVLEQKANYASAVTSLGVAALCGGLGLFGFFPDYSFFFLLSAGAFGIGSLIDFAATQNLVCTLDKSTGFITHQLGERAAVQYLLADLQAVVIKQRVVGWGRNNRQPDVFKLQLLLKPGAYLDVSMAELKLSQAQAVAQQIQQFVGPPVVVQGED